MIIEPVMEDNEKKFPVGMRILAVDDDPTCLYFLESLLRRCKYHVTATNEAATALKLLRENRDKFDLVISDVHMPDMDGFKLLEVIGLEMDLPVIMLSANANTKVVLKGITHGACDYLLKPVRIEELKNIWQHVVRRKKSDSKETRNSGNQNASHTGSGEGGPGTAEAPLDQNGKPNKRRKDQNEAEDEDHEANGHNDSSTQKKPRVVWSLDLHGKFVAAVKQLGVDKAVPKKILEMMNVENLTRENVASHLQKYRLYLRRLSSMANQQANMAAALGSADTSYLQMGSLNGLENFQSLNGSGQFHDTAFRSFPASRLLGRSNTPAGLGVRSLFSSGMMQLGHAQNSSSSGVNQVNWHHVILPGVHNQSLLQGMPTALELDPLQHVNDFQDAKVTSGSSNNSLLYVTNNSVMFEQNPQGAQGNKIFGDQSSVTVASFSPYPMLDYNRVNDNWSNNDQSSRIQTNAFSLHDGSKPPTLHYNNLRENMSTMASPTLGNPSDVSSVTSMSTQLQDIRADLQFQASLVNNNAGQLSEHAPTQVWNNHNQDGSYSSNVRFSSMNSMIPVNCAGGPSGQGLEPNNSNFQANRDVDAFGHANYCDPLYMKNDQDNKSAMEASLRLHQGLLMDQRMPQGSHISSGFGSLEEAVTPKWEPEQAKDLASSNFFFGRPSGS